MKNVKPGLVATAAAGVLAAGAVLVPVAANAANNPVAPNATAAPSAGSSQGSGFGQRPQEEALTGDAAANVKAAVEAKYPGATIERMEKDADGGAVYEAHIVKADGTRVTVQLDATYAVTGEQAGGMGGRGGHGPQGTQVTGADLDKVKAGVTAKDSGATVDFAVKLSDGTYRAFTHKADGTRTIYTLDSSFKVTGAEAAPMGGRGEGHRGGGFAGQGTEVTGDTLTKLTAAVTAKVPGATVDRAVKLSDGSYVALARTSDGTRVLVKLDKNLVVTGTQDAPQRGMRGNGAPSTDGSTRASG